MKLQGNAVVCSFLVLLVLTGCQKYREVTNTGPSQSDSTSLVDSGAEVESANHVQELHFSVQKGGQGNLLTLIRQRSILTVVNFNSGSLSQATYTYVFDSHAKQLTTKFPSEEQSFSQDEEGYLANLNIMLGLAQTVQAHHQYPSTYDEAVRRFINVLTSAIEKAEHHQSRSRREQKHR